MLVWFPGLIVPTLPFYVFVIGAWNYRLHSKASLLHFDTKISLTELIDRDELDEEFDAMPCMKPEEMVRVRYVKLRMLGPVSRQCWDPRATGIFVGLCFVAAFILHLVPLKMMAMAFEFYCLRHPIFGTTGLQFLPTVAFTYGSDAVVR
ncbi:multiple C2 domain and transmembrane region protein 16-like [Primulina huaijiensis]|uniref:multiple C2 domain and transmembrane region protein 16-like n=1 Tax=Primulina huaijiensis TaxID=1492673 RepID=UPI003CC78437